MSAKSEFAAYCAELLAGLGDVRVGRMFGGHGIYVDDLFVAIVTGEVLYLKADDQTQAAFEDAGGRCFAFESRGKQVATHFWTPPAQAMDSPREMAPWARLALDAALRARAAKAPRRRR